ncbi:MAG TPA: hypothetical protein VJT49_33870 [Amycolatopsis sp.]|uniref:hypothetical protein n=1 Tax=Amycolatopsis sp. TaxID=37632 RepID=UPI002B49F850|nr:hypothetical protein [Amycolatopsis sp.]HKS50011.1 hypothetical protein [Amycolatopsis sp.]
MGQEKGKYTDARSSSAITFEICSGDHFFTAYAFDKCDFRHREKLFGLVLVGVMVPPAVLTLPLYLLASSFGVVNTMGTVFVPSLPNPFGVYLGRISGADHVPGEVLETAGMDGAGELGSRCECWAPGS